MLVEPPILDGEHGPGHLGRNCRERDGAPLLALAADERRQHWRLELQAVDRLGAEIEVQHPVRRPRPRRHAYRGSSARRREPLEYHANEPAAKLGAPGHDADHTICQLELAGLFNRWSLRVAEIVQTVDQLPVRQ